MEEFRQADHTKAPELQELDQALRIGAEAMKKAVQNPQFLAEVYSNLKFYEEQVHEHDMNRFAAVSFAELESENALHRTDGTAMELSGSESSGIFTAALQSADTAVRQPNQQNLNLHKFLIEDLANLYMPNFELWPATIDWIEPELDEQTQELKHSWSQGDSLIVTFQARSASGKMQPFDLGLGRFPEKNCCRWPEEVILTESFKPTQSQEIFVLRWKLPSDLEPSQDSNFYRIIIAPDPQKEPVGEGGNGSYAIVSVE